MTALSHSEFVAGYRSGRLRVSVDRRGAADFVSRRMLLPFVLLPVLGIAVALALALSVLAGAVLFLAALLARHFVRATSQGFVLSRALESEPFYRDAVAAGVLRVEESGEPGGVPRG
ncbi:MAG: hypothetical protein AB1773_16255 [Pseudomonadota bacterium]